MLDNISPTLAQRLLFAGGAAAKILTDLLHCEHIFETTFFHTLEAVFCGQETQIYVV